MDDHEQSEADLFGFLSGLATQRFAVGIDQLNAVQQLLVELILRREMPERREDLRDFVAPIICRSPEEQLGFHKLFDDWSAKSGANQIATENLPMPPSQAFGEVDSPDYTSLSSLIRFLLAGIVAVIMLIAVAYFIVTFSSSSNSNQDTEASSGYADGLVRDINGNPVKNANVSAWQHTALPADERPSNPDRTVTTGSDGTFKLPLSDLTYPIVITASAKGYGTQSQLVSAIEEAHGIRLTLPIDGLWGQWKWVAVAAGLLSLLTLVVLSARARHLHLRKWQTTKRLHIDQLIVHGATEWLSQLLLLRRSAQNLRRPRDSGPGDVDLLRTIEASIRLGNFTPVYNPRKNTPEYLVLINRSSANDQVANFQDKIVDHLKENGVYIDRYYYRKDPRLCSSGQSQSRVHTLQELATIYPLHNLLIFDDGSGLFHPATARLIHTLERFSQSPIRALLSSDFPLDEYRQQKLSEIDLLVLPSTAEGIAGLSEIISGGSWRPDPAIQTTDDFPSVLRETEARLLDEVKPPDDVISRLLAQLRPFLHDSFGWLAACAVYPQVSWELTLYLGYTLLSPEKVATNLPRMLRLPWFRQGSMPDWFRETLVSELSTEEINKIRTALNHLLASAWNNDEGFILPISRKFRVSELEFWDGSWRDLKQKLNDWRQRAAIKDFLRSQPSDSRLRDRVFLSFMVGKRPSGLAHPIPRELRRLFFHTPPSSSGTVILYTIMSCLFVGEFWLAAANLNIFSMLGILITSYLFFYGDIQIRQQSTLKSIKSLRSREVSTESSIKNIRRLLRLGLSRTIRILCRATSRQFGVAFYIFIGIVFGVGLNVSLFGRSVAEFLILALGLLLFILGVRKIGPTTLPEQLGAVGFLLIGIVTEIELARAISRGSLAEEVIIMVVSFLCIYGLRQITTGDSLMAWQRKNR